MENYLIQMLGLYLTIVGVIVLLTQRTLIPALRDLAKNRGVLVVLGALELIAGLSLVLAYPMVELSVIGILSLLGYVLLLEGILYLAAPAKLVKKMFTAFNRPGWYMGGGILSIILGVYLTTLGFHVL
jgi:hypothetical protein